MVASAHRAERGIELRRFGAGSNLHRGNVPIPRHIEGARALGSFVEPESGASLIFATNYRYQRGDVPGLFGAWAAPGYLPAVAAKRRNRKCCSWPPLIRGGQDDEICSVCSAAGQAGQRER